MRNQPHIISRMLKVRQHYYLNLRRLAIIVTLSQNTWAAADALCGLLSAAFRAYFTNNVAASQRPKFISIQHIWPYQPAECWMLVENHSQLLPSSSISVRCHGTNALCIQGWSLTLMTGLKTIAYAPLVFTVLTYFVTPMSIHPFFK